MQEEQGIPEKTYDYWQRKTRQATYAQLQQTAFPAVAGVPLPAQRKENGCAFVIENL